MTPLTVTLEDDTDLIVTRSFNAPPALVWRAHTEPDLIRKWLLGPDGWTMPTCISEPVAGGRIHYAWAKGDAGFHLTGEFLSLTPHHRIEHVERMHLPDPTPDNHVVTTFTPHGSGTLMKMRMHLPDLATRSAMLATGMTDGMETSYARLDAMTEVSAI